MAADPASFRDQFVSLFQSAVDQVVRETAPSAGLATRPGIDNALVNAAATLASMKSQGQTTVPDVAPGEVAQDAWTCAKMGFALMEARARGDTRGPAPGHAPAAERGPRAGAQDPGGSSPAGGYL